MRLQPKRITMQLCTSQQSIAYIDMLIFHARAGTISSFRTLLRHTYNLSQSAANPLSLSCVQIAAVFEFAGALLLGRVSTATIAGGIASVGAYAREPEFYAYGMMISLLVSGVWQIVASYFELNVSATHSISESQ